MVDFRGGVIKDLYIVDATDAGTGNDKWDSTTVMEWEVPANRSWLFIGGTVLNSVDATVTVDLYDASDKVVLGLASIAAPGAATRVQFPDSDIGYVHRPIPMATGWYVKMTMGAAQGAAAEANILIIEYTG
jgi:hypothetical protein